MKQNKRGKKMKVGQCRCESEDIQYNGSFLEGNQIGYEFDCNECEKSGIEWHELTYRETVMKD